jgi:Catalytic LigB subunit of aromatic ring-opening dioxygenase
MGEVLGIGCTHGPHPALPDERMADVYFRRNLASELTPPEWKDPKNWPAEMREEWGDDEGVAAARKHRAELVKGFRAAREALDEFNPDFVLIFGDDQYENFHEDVIPPFCVYALDEVECRPRAPRPRNEEGAVVAQARAAAPPDEPLIIQGQKAAGNHIARELIEGGFDVSCSWRLHHMEQLGHAFVSTVRYLDWDKKGFPYPVVPFHVNCYGMDLRVPSEANPAGSVIGRRMENVSVSPPPSPPPWRCYDLGSAVTRIIEDSPWRAAVIGSSSWSHASLTQKHYYMYPDVDQDRKRYHELKSGATRQWRDLKAEQIRDSGQHEILNWVCLAGAMDGRNADVLAYSESFIFNSSKAVALFS